MVRLLPRGAMVRAALLPCLGLVAAAQEQASGPRVFPDPPAGWPEPRAVPGAAAKSAAEMRAYREPISGSDQSFELVPIAAGSFTMGSPEDERARGKDEGPTHPVEVAAFWMGKHEVRWDEYHLFMFQIDRKLREGGVHETVPQDAWADAVSRPTPPYVPMDFDMGVEGYPAICMTQFAAKQYTKWLSMKTGRFYRLPTEAEWEYACRAGTTTAYSFGDDADALEEYGWFFDNADDAYHPVGIKKPNPWGLHDMHGNVAEWVLDGYEKFAYKRAGEPGSQRDPLIWPAELYPRVVRGGSWDDDPPALRSAARRASRASWKVQDPQLPKSIWYHTDATFVGFRVVRPLVPPAREEWERYWAPDVDAVREIMDKQRKGGR